MNREIEAVLEGVRDGSVSVEQAALRLKAAPFEDLGYKPFRIDHALLEKMGFKNVSMRVRDAWRDAIDSGEEYGYRNAQVSVIAPTGTISFAMDCGATSAEPTRPR